MGAVSVTRPRPKVLAATRVKAQPVRDLILEVAERLYATHGMSGVGLLAISADAKVNLASIAYHFGS